MRTFFKTFRDLSLSGLLSTSYKVMAVTALFMFCFGPYLGLELEILIFILTPVALMLDYDANKYVISYSLPIYMKQRLQMLYYVTILDSFIAVLVVHLRCIFSGIERSLVVSSIVFLADIIGSNLCYYLFCSQEFKKDVLDEDKRQLLYQGIVGGLIGIGIAMRIKWGLESPILMIVNNLSWDKQIVLVGVCTVVMVLWTRMSMRKLEKVVRDGR